MSPSQKKAWKSLIAIFVAVGAIGVFIALFKSYHQFVGLFLAVWLLSYFVRVIRQPANYKGYKLFSMFAVLFTLFFGLTVEIWGTENGYWKYLGIEDHISIPYWVPFAWGFSYKVMYKIERIILDTWEMSLAKKVLYVLVLPSLIVPVWGEIVVINLGVWLYNWPYQFFGVPILAAFLLVLFHVGVNTVMYLVCRYFKLPDPVYTKLL